MTILADKNIHDAFDKILNNKPKLTDLNDPLQYVAKSKYEQQRALPVEDKRQMLHDSFMAQQAAQPESEPIVALPKEGVTNPDPIEKIKDDELTKQAATTQQILPVEQGAQTTNQKAEEVAQNVTKPGEELSNEEKIAALNTNKEQIGMESPEKINNEDSNIEDQATKALLKRPTDTSGPTEDMQKYAALKDIMKQHIQNGDMDRTKMVWGEMEALKNKYGGMPPFKTGGVAPGQTVEQHIKSGNATTGSVLKMISDKGNEWSPLAKSMLETASGSKLENQVLSHGGMNTSRYDPITRTVSIHNQHLTDTGVIMHEMAHSVISDSLPKEFEKLRGAGLKYAMDNYLQDDSKDRRVKELIKTYYQAAQQLNINKALFEGGSFENHPTLGKGSIEGVAGNPKEAMKFMGQKGYAMSNLHEFTAMSLSDPSFQKKLNELKANNGTNQSLWSRFVEAVRNLIGIPVKQGSLLEKALKVNEDLMKIPNRGYETDEEGNRYYESPEKKLINVGRIASGTVEDSGALTGQFKDENGRQVMKDKIREAFTNKFYEDRGRENKTIPTAEELDSIDKHADDFIRRLGLESNYHESPKKIQEERTEEPLTKRMGKIGEVFRSGIDTIKSLAHPDAEKVAGALQKTLQEREAILGRQLNPVLDAAKGLPKASEERLQAAKRYELENHQPAPLSMFKTKQEQTVWSAYKNSLKANFNERLANKEPVIANGMARLPISDPNYHPTTSNPKVAEILRANTDPKGIADLNKQWNDYYTQKLGKTPQQAQDAFNRYRRALQGNAMNSGSNGNQAFFNAARRPQGEPLPPSFERPGFLRNFESYAIAQSMDNAYYKHVESDPKVMSALGYQHDPWGKPVPQSENQPISGNTAVKNVLNEIKGEANTSLQGQVIAKSESLATATLLGPLTEFHKLASNFAKQLSNYASDPIQAGRALAYGATHIAEGWTHAKENGKIVMTAKAAGDMFNSQLTAADRIAGIARGVRQIYTLNDLTDKLNLGFLQASGEYLIPYKLHAADGGDASAIRLMRHLDPDWNTGKTYDAKGISVLASQLAGVVHGTRDARTMPSWMLHDNEISAFFKLSSWGIAQTNSFMRDVYTPATEGNLKPLLMSAFGAAVGGYMIKELRQDIAGKKSQIPSLAEIGSSDRGYKGNIPAIAYNMMAAASYAGFGGMLSTIGRYPFDMAFKNTPQGATFPLDTVVT